MSVRIPSRTGLTVLGILGGLVALSAAVIVITPRLVFPKIIKTLPDPFGRYVAEVVVEPHWRGPIARFMTALDDMTVDICVRIREAAPGWPIMGEDLLTEMEDCVQDAEAVMITWDDRGTARFISRRGEMRLLRPSRIIQ